MKVTKLIIAFTMVVICQRSVVLTTSEYEQSIVDILQLLSIRNPIIISGNIEMKLKKSIARLLMDRQQIVAFSEQSDDLLRHKNCDFATILTEEDYKTPHLLENIIASQPYLSKNVVFINDSTSIITRGCPFFENFEKQY
jgi:hypothetical protein